MEGNWKNWYAWSRSRRSMFENCQRKFYFRYVKFYDVSKGDLLRSTKNMIERKYTNINFLLGKIVHDAIKRQFDQLSRGRDVSDPDPILKFISRTSEEIRENPKDFIIESLNGEEILPEAIIKIEKEAVRQFKIFFNEYFGFFKDLVIMEHEEYCYFEINDCRFYLMPDIVTKSNDGVFYITEWKTDSTYSQGIDEWQMNLYILWALTKHNIELENLKAEVVFLDIGDSSDYSVTETVLEKFKVELISEAEKLFNNIDEKSEMKDFKKCVDEKICVRCGYNEYCNLNK